MSKHTPGGVTFKRGQFGSSVFVIYGKDGFPIAQTISNSSPEGMERARRGEHEANARRLAACWNACEGLSTEHLEQHGLPGFAQAISDLRAQRDELLEALRFIANVTECGVTANDCQIHDRASAAIRKATGEQA